MARVLLPDGEIHLSIRNGEHIAKTFDANGQWISMPLNQELKTCAEKLHQARVPLLPQWTQEKIQLTAEKQAAETLAEEALQRAAEKESKIRAMNAEILKIISGGTAQPTPELIALYAQWDTDLSVDAGDVYQDGGVIYVATKDHITSKANRPGTSGGKGYWHGGIHGDGTTQPTPGVTTKYTKGQVILWSGVHYKANKNTDYDPGERWQDWDLASNGD